MGACIVTLDERRSGDVVIDKLARRAAGDLHARPEAMVRRQPHTVRTITADTGTEFPSDTPFESRVPLKFSYATPQHSWERGFTESMNGLIRQYRAMGVSMER